MWQLIVFKSCDKYINSTKMVLTDIKICFMWKSSTIIICAILLWMSKWNFLNGKYKRSQVHCPILHNRKFSKSLVKNFKIWLSSLKRFSIYWTLVTCTVTIQILCLLKGDDSSEKRRWILSWKGRSSPSGSNCWNGFVVQTVYTWKSLNSI